MLQLWAADGIKWRKDINIFRLGGFFLTEKQLKFNRWGGIDASEYVSSWISKPETDIMDRFGDRRIRSAY